MPRRVIIAISVVLVVALIAAAAVYLLRLRGPLAGPWRHDFGDVSTSASAGGAKLQHTFVLRNRTDHTLTIHDISSTCGCTKAEASRTSIPSGEKVRVEVVFTLGGMSKKHANIHLDLGEDGVKTLTVAATPVRDSS